MLTSDDLRNALEKEVPDQRYIHELTPIVKNFALTHEQHLIFLSCDLGDTSCAPWWIQQPSFEEWLEISGPFDSYNYLPRNLIERGCRTWEQVLVQMEKEYPFEFADFKECADLIELIRVAFERRLAS